MKEICPLLGESQCIREKCIGYCSLNKRKIYLEVPTLKKCECGAYLIPYGEIYLHPDNSCKYSEMLEVKVIIHSDEYEKELGNPEQTYQELIEHLLTTPKSWWDRLKDWWDGK